MKGAREFAGLFVTGQYGKLYIVSGEHARGRTFHIQVLPEGEKAVGNGLCNTCLNKDAVEVYGIVAGNPGWTEEYGWLHDGPWQNDFATLCANTQEKQSTEYRMSEEAKEVSRKLEEERVQSLLSNY